MADRATAYADDDVVVPAQRDTRSRRRRMVAPMATAAGVAAGLVYLAAVDPNEPGHYPLCPTQALFGVDCPGCGVMRGMHALITGDVRGALDHNVLLVALVPLAILLWVRWAARSWTGQTSALTYTQFRRRNALVIGGLVLVTVFGIVRNFVPYLGSGLS
jgi:hypothetical protein